MSNSSLANKTTISSRNKMALLNGIPTRQEILKPTPTTTTTTASHLSATAKSEENNNMQPTSQIARNRAIKSQSSISTNLSASNSISRLANLANGYHPKTAMKPTTNSARVTNNNNVPITPKTGTLNQLKSSSHTAQTALRPVVQNRQTRIPPSTTAKSDRLQAAAPIFKKPSALMAPSSREGLIGKQQNQIPDTNQIRKGLAKFSNPMECQRQFQALSSKIQVLEDSVEARDKKVAELQDQLKRSMSIGVGYATAVQYLAAKLKLDSKLDLTQECKQLKEKVNELILCNSEHEQRVEAIISDYTNQLQVEKDLKVGVQEELERTKLNNLELVDGLKNLHNKELDDLNKNHKEVEENLTAKIERLEAELETTSKELSDLRIEHETLTNDFNKLEESLTKDKDARVKYLQEKINQLQKDVESLNSVLEMRLEKIHALEKDSLLLVEAQNDLITYKDTIKSLSQQLESVNAALNKKREQYENLIAEHENLRQELNREKFERRRITMKSEQLEYVLNESCASESNIVANSSIRDVSSDQLI